MKEKSIIFNAEMVRAILDGRKTQTRRVVKGNWLPLVEEVLRVNGKWVFETIDYDLTTPFGEVGDRLWVKEKAKIIEFFEGRQNPYICDDFEEDRCYIQYSDGVVLFEELVCENHINVNEVAQAKRLRGKNISAIFMPRWASRITLEITDIRVERLKDISEEDAIAEGVFKSKDYFHSTIHPTKGTYQCWPNAKTAFEKLWESIKGKGSWAENPFVWVVSFKVINGGK